MQAKIRKGIGLGKTACSQRKEKAEQKETQSRETAFPQSTLPNAKMKARAVQNDGTTELKSRGNVLRLPQKKFKIHKEQAFFAVF